MTFGPMVVVCYDKPMLRRWAQRLGFSAAWEFDARQKELLIAQIEQETEGEQ